MTELNATPEKELPAEPQLPGSEAEEASLDDWARALAEQNANSAVNATPAGVFQPLSKVEPNTTRNDIDMILDIPVQMTVELGRTKIAIRNLLQLGQGSAVDVT